MFAIANQSSDVSLDFPYALADCFSAMKSAISTRSNMDIENENEAAGMIMVDVEGGFTSFTFGDIITIIFTENQNRSTKININSAAKCPSALASVQESKNIKVLTEAFSTCIANYPKLEVYNQDTGLQSIKSRIDTLNELHNAGLLTEEEYAQKRAELLASI